MLILAVYYDSTFQFFKILRLLCIFVGLILHPQSNDLPSLFLPFFRVTLLFSLQVPKSEGSLDQDRVVLVALKDVEEDENDDTDTDYVSRVFVADVVFDEQHLSDKDQQDH